MTEQERREALDASPLGRRVLDEQRKRGGREAGRARFSRRDEDDRRAMLEATATGRRLLADERLVLDDLDPDARGRVQLRQGGDLPHEAAFSSLTYAELDVLVEDYIAKIRESGDVDAVDRVDALVASERGRQVLRQIVEAELDAATSAIGAETDAVLAPSTNPHLQRAERLVIAEDLARREVVSYTSPVVAVDGGRPGDLVGTGRDGRPVVYRRVEGGASR